MHRVETLIVGAGFSGICMGIKLQQAGRNSFLIVEKLGDLGGTWTVNRYPGCECDVPSHLYSYSFYPNPDWTTAFASRGEIHNYLQSCAIHYGILPDHIRFHTRATTATWDNDAMLWRVELVSNNNEPYIVFSRFLVSAVGMLSVPTLPSVPGIQNFRGVSVHSHEWMPSVDELLSGKRVAVVGTGASAVQIVPEVARVAEKLYVVQRTPAWILPKPGFCVPKWCREAFRCLPLLMWLWRVLILCFMEFFGSGVYGGAVFPLLVIKKTIQKVAKHNMEVHIKDVELRKRLTPTYHLGCKRLLLSNHFYPALARPNVELISGSLVEVRENNIVVKPLEDGSDEMVEIPLDTIIYATGFDVSQPKLHVVGSNPDSPLPGSSSPSFLGVTKHGFPNFFTIMGPHSYVGHTSLLLIIEAQARYILSCVDLVLKQNAQSLEVKLCSEDRFQEFLARRFSRTVWQNGGCANSWYVDSMTGQNSIIWPGSTIEYIWHTSSASLDDYTICYAQENVLM